MKLVLFDVDGTLLSASGAGRRALDQAMRDVYGTAGPIDGYDFRGGTDPQIIRDLLGRAGLDEAAIAAGEADVYRRYEALLETEIGDGRGVTVYPGVRELVEALAARDDVLVGLLTGNIEAGARIKLRPTGLWPRFRLGAYGSDHADRTRLPKVAAGPGRASGGPRVSGDGHRDHRRHAPRHRVRPSIRGEGDRGGDRLAQSGRPHGPPPRPRVRRPLGPHARSGGDARPLAPRWLDSSSCGFTSSAPWPGWADYSTPATSSYRPRRGALARRSPLLRRGRVVSWAAVALVIVTGLENLRSMAVITPWLAGKLLTVIALLALAAHRDFALLPRAIQAIERGGEPGGALSGVRMLDRVVLMLALVVLFLAVGIARGR